MSMTSRDAELSPHDPLALESVRPMRRCPCRRAGRLVSSALHPASLRFWLPRQRKFSHVGIDFDPARATFALWCLRRNQRRELEVVNAVPNRFRLRELEATLVELSVTLPEPLRRFFLATLGEDPAEILARRSAVAAFMCACNGDATEALTQRFAA